MPPAPIEFYFDFASPYAWFALDRIEQIAARYRRQLDWHPVLVWAVLRAHKQPTPFDFPQRRDYMMADMKRSAAYYGVPYKHPNLPMSAHLATRVYYSVAKDDFALARRFGTALLRGFFVEGADTSDLETVARIASDCGIDPAFARTTAQDAGAKAALVRVNEAAAARGVFGSPFFVIGEERFFGADRLDQLDWFLSRQG